MAAIVNARDVLLQAAAVRIDPVPITIGDVTGLTEALKGVRITASATSFFGSSGATTPATITLTAERVGGVIGPVVWSVISGSGTVTPSGDTCTVTGSTVTGQSITLRARVTDGAINYDAQIVLTKLGTLASQGVVNLATQITGQLANGNVSGLGALALLGNVNLANTTQVQGDLVASRIAAGTFAAGVIYAGTVNVENLVGTTITGKNIASADRVYIGGGDTFGPIVLRGNGGSGPGPYPYTCDARFNGYFYTSYNGSGGFIENGPSGITLRNPSAGGISIGKPNPYVGAVTITASPLTIETGNLVINTAGTLSGSLGSRIILKGVTYNAEVNGSTTPTTVKFL